MRQALRYAQHAQIASLRAAFPLTRSCAPWLQTGPRAVGSRCGPSLPCPPICRAAAAQATLPLPAHPNSWPLLAVAAANLRRRRARRRGVRARPPGRSGHARPGGGPGGGLGRGGLNAGFPQCRRSSFVKHPSSFPPFLSFFVERTHDRPESTSGRACDRQLHSPSFAPSGARGPVVW